MSMKFKLPENLNGYSIEWAEPYYDIKDGAPSVALIWNGTNLKLKTLLDWKEEEPIISKYLEETFFSSPRRLWKYPTTPILPENDMDIVDLHIDIQRCNNDYIEFPNSAWPSTFATWLMGSYLAPFLHRSPILPTFGPSESGKGQILDQVDRLGYRGKKMISPTPAVMYRLADRWRMTFALDELQDLDKESFRAIMNIVKGSYDGTPVSRCDSNTGDVQEFQTRGFIALSLKGAQPAEDIKNRGILLTMQRNGEPKSLVPDDSPEHQDIRARLMGLRLRALSDPDFINGYLEKVQVQGTPEALGFDRRPKDIAVSLLLPAIMSHEEEALIEIIQKSSAEARDEINSTFTARVQHTYEDLIEGVSNVTRYYPILTIRAHLQDELRDDGDIKENEKLRTQRVTNALKTLGYELTRRTNNAPFIDRESKQNKLAFEINRKKYAIEKDASEA